MGRWIVVLVVVLILSGYLIWLLHPALNLYRLNKKQDTNFSKIKEIADISTEDIENALLNKNLESIILKRLKDSSNEQVAQELSQETIALNKEIIGIKRKAIEKALARHGGIYLVYEVDTPHFLKGVAKNTDAQLKQLIEQSDYEAKHQNQDFFDVFQAKIQENGIPINRYFGKKAESELHIINDLRKASRMAIDQTLKVLQNRIAECGISKFFVTKESQRRIVVEIAKVKDIDRAKAVIGKTAQLEFKLLRDPEYTRLILLKIDEIAKKKRAGSLNSKTLAEIKTLDFLEQSFAKEKEKIRDEKEVDLDELFADASGEKGYEEDSLLSVDIDMFEENPFLALLGNFANMIAAPKQNMKAVDMILDYPEVQDIIPDESEFLWSSKSERINDKDWFFLYFVKSAPEITGDYIEDANVNIAGATIGSSMTGAGEAEVLLKLNSRGAKIFARITGANVGKFLAIVLDDKVASAPQIRERIPNGRVSITGMRDIDEAKDLVVLLRSGALPMRLVSIEAQPINRKSR